MSFTMKMPGKKYGLVKPKKKKPMVKNAFAAIGGDDSDEDNMTTNQRIILEQQAAAHKAKKIQAEQAAVLAEDSSAYDYDGVYDKMQNERAESARSRKAVEQVRKPKYIKNILKMAEFKKREEERVTGE